MLFMDMWSSTINWTAKLADQNAPILWPHNLSSLSLPSMNSHRYAYRHYKYSKIGAGLNEQTSVCFFQAILFNHGKHLWVVKWGERRQGETAFIHYRQFMRHHTEVFQPAIIHRKTAALVKKRVGHRERENAFNSVCIWNNKNERICFENIYIKILTILVGF